MEQADLVAIVARMHEVGLRQWMLDALTDAFEAARKGKLKSQDGP